MVSFAKSGINNWQEAYRSTLSYSIPLFYSSLLFVLCDEESDEDIAHLNHVLRTTDLL